ncbi:MAG: dihydrolipoyl dehydrogenase [Treponema sp.]|jgi:dihydrolipoamide dehydrogenase|nr:dihydrolipoyl dehydrogenase [Treponema sp.]
MADTFDAVVIGGGPGGYICAIRCAQLGKKTALVENRELGGTCLNRGCIPTKTLLHTAELYSEIKRHGKELGLNGELSLNFGALADRKDQIIEKLRRGIEALVKGRKITLIRETAELTGSKSFRAGTVEYAADNIVIASGSEPAAIPVPGADRPEVLNSDGVLALRDLPGSAVIIGGGVIGVEFAALLSSFGRKVTVIEMLPRILNGMDEDICEAMTRLLKKQGVDVHTGAKVLEIAGGGLCRYEEGGVRKEAVGDIVIMAVGRRPLTKNLGLEKAGLVSERGFIPADEGLRTKVSGIYAIGDVTGKAQLAHVASAQGLIAAANIAGKNASMTYAVIPACVYTNPEIAGIGMTETQLIAAGLPYRRGNFPAAANGRSRIMNCTEGFVKILSHKNTGEILGAHIMAPRASDMIGEIAAAMRAEAVIEELADTIHAHPTINEMIMEAAHDAEGFCCHKL